MGFLDMLGSLVGGGIIGGGVPYGLAQGDGAFPTFGSGTTVAPSGGSQGILGSLGDFIRNKPEQSAIMLDALGKGFDPNNAFAGIGTSMGQSSLANKALADENKQKQDWRKMISDVISGKVPMTAAGQEGISGLTVKPGKEGGSSEISLNITEPTDEGKAKSKLGSLSMSEIMSSPF